MAVKKLARAHTGTKPPQVPAFGPKKAPLFFRATHNHIYVSIINLLISHSIIWLHCKVCCPSLPPKPLVYTCHVP